MQHVNVCLQALLKRLGKACREQEKEKEGGRESGTCVERNSGKEKQRGRKSPCAQCDRRQQGLCCPRRNIPPPTSITNFLHPPPPLPWGPAVKSTIRPISLLTPFCAPSPTSPNRPHAAPCNPEHRAQVEWAKKEGLKGEEMAEKGGWRKDINCTHPPPPLLVSKDYHHHSWCFLFLQPAQRPETITSQEQKKKREDRKNSLLLCIPLVLHYGTIPPQGGEGGWGWAVPRELPLYSSTTDQTSTSCLTILRLYKVKLTHLNLLYLFSCNMIFKHVPLKQKESELHPCKRPPMIWGTPSWSEWSLVQEHIP